LTKLSGIHHSSICKQQALRVFIQNPFKLTKIMSRKITIAGGSGHIGSSIVDELLKYKDEFEVVVLSRQVTNLHATSLF
jgi:FlaA1/EpsC-like NDP-sugar epimerase